jgi:hypothetical protein
VYCLNFQVDQLPALGVLGTRSDGCEFVDVKCSGVTLVCLWLRSVERRIT